MHLMVQDSNKDSKHGKQNTYGVEPYGLPIGIAVTVALPVGNLKNEL